MCIIHKTVAQMQHIFYNRRNQRFKRIGVRAMRWKGRKATITPLDTESGSYLVNIVARESVEDQADNTDFTRRGRVSTDRAVRSNEAAVGFRIAPCYQGRKKCISRAKYRLSGSKKLLSEGKNPLISDNGKSLKRPLKRRPFSMQVRRGFLAVYLSAKVT